MLPNSIISNLEKSLKLAKGFMKPSLTNITTCGGEVEIIVVLFKGA